LNQVNALIERECLDCAERNLQKKKNFQPSADQLIPMWIYVICNADLNNLLTECSFLVDFRLKDFTTMSESDYILTNFMCAIDSFKKEISSGGNKTNNLTPYVIFSKTSMPESAPEISYVRTNSMYSVRSNMTDTSQGGLIGSMASSLRGLFK
jgi:hypothetical protein